MELGNIQELIAVTHLETALAELYTSAPLVWRVLMEAVCILAAQTLPKSPQRRTGRGSLKHCLLQRCSYQNEVPRWDSPPLPLRHFMPVSRECGKRNKMAWPGTHLQTKFLLVNSQCFHPNVCCAQICAVQKILDWRAALVLPFTFGSHVPAISLIRSVAVWTVQCPACSEVPVALGCLHLWMLISPQHIQAWFSENWSWAFVKRRDPWVTPNCILRCKLWFT